MAGESRHERPVRREGRRHRRRRRGGPEALLPPHAAGRDHRRLPQPVEALLGRLPGGLLLQAPRRLGAAGPPPRGAHRHHRLPGRGGAAGPAGRRRGRGRAPAARLQEIFGRDNLFVELQDHGLADQQRTNPQLVAMAKRLGAPLLATNDSHYTHRADAVAHDALLCVQTGATLADTNRFRFEGTEHYLKSAARDAPPVRRGARGLRQHPADRRAGPRGAGAGQAEPARVPRPRGLRRRDLRGRGPSATCATSPIEGAERRYGSRCPTRCTTHRLRAGVIGDMGFAAYFLVVWDLIRYARSRGSGWARARLGGRLLRGLLPVHRRPGPHPLRPAVRALLEPGPQADARHRHGLRRAVPGRDDPLRRRALRQRPRGPDRDLLDDQGPGRGARRRRVLGLPYIVGDKIAKAMPPLVMGRDTPLWAAWKKSEGHEDGYAAAGELRAMYERTPTPSRSSTWPRGSRGSAARTGSTPRRWSSPKTRSPSTCPSSASPTPRATSRTPPSSPSTRCTGWRRWAC